MQLCSEAMMARRGDICKDFDATMFRYFIKKKYKYRKTFTARMGVSSQIVSCWLSGQKKPTYKNLFKMADVLGVDPRQLVTRHGQRILNDWQLKLSRHLFDDAPVEVKKIKNKAGEMTTITIQRTFDRDAIDLTARLGYFDQTIDETESEQTAAEKYYDDLTDEVPEAYKNLDEAEA
ncbi:helix-turn-helix transcriptional regulator [Candidatus Poribacteria bacterium]|nr:helix-turn-helix transcriptional regulator [Candidatus Poribacteria bacterium]